MRISDWSSDVCSSDLKGVRIVLPVLVIAGLGNSFGLDVMVLFRPPNNPYIAEKVFSFRSARMGQLVPSHAGSSFALRSEERRGGKACVSPCRSLWSPFHSIKNKLASHLVMNYK